MNAEPRLSSTHEAGADRALYAIPPVSRRATVQVLDDEALVHVESTGQIHWLNRTAYRVWRNCDGRRTINDLVETLRVDRDVDEETARDHVLQLVVFFAGCGLLETDDERCGTRR